MGQAKSLLRFRGRTFLEHILDAIRQTSVAYTAVVVGHHRKAIEESVEIEHIVYNPDYELGMITSIQAGIRALPNGIDGALLFLVDHPAVEPDIVHELIRRFAAGHIILPVYQGRRGHPVLFSRESLDEILALPLSSGANIVVRRDPSRIVEVPVNSPGVTIDIDTPEQFERFLKNSELE